MVDTLSHIGSRKQLRVTLRSFLFAKDSTKRNQKTREDSNVLTKRWTILQHTDYWNRNAGSGVSKCGSRQGLHECIDSISHQFLWKALEKYGIESNYFSLLRRLFAEQKGTVSMDKESDMFETKRGTKQGDPLSSVLFNAMLQITLKDDVEHWQNSKGLGIRLGDY